MSKWPQHKAYFWEYAPVFRVLMPLIGGIIYYQRSPGISLSLPVGVALLVAVSAAYVLCSLAVKSFNTRVISFLLLQVIFFSCGYLLSYSNDAATTTNWYGNTITANHTYLGRITDAPAEKEQSWKLQVEMISLVDARKGTPVAGKAFVYVFKGREPMLFHKGDTVLVPGNWVPVTNAGNPYEFDYAAYCRRNNIYYQQFCSPGDVRLYAAVIPAAMPYTTRMHDWCMEQLDGYLTDAKTKGLIQAMLLGDEVNLDNELRQSFSDTGIVHIIAISGGNIMMFFALISVLLWWVRHRKYLWLKYLIALPLVWFYVVMAGSSPSAVRAAIMFSLLSWGLMFRKDNNSLNQLFATAFILLCVQPMWLFSIGFQLSFIAVLSLILFYPSVHTLWVPKTKIVKALWATVCASFAAELLVAPVVIFYFHNFPLLFLVANVAAYLFMGLVLILGITIIAVSWLPAVANAIGLVTTGLVNAFNGIIQWMQGLNPLSFHFLQLTGIELLLLYTAIAGIAYFIFRQRKVALFTGLCAFAVFIMLLCAGKTASNSQEKFVVYNAGRGSHIEYISGYAYHVTGIDTISPQKVDYAVKPSHTQWQAWHNGGPINEELFHINGKTILVLNQQMDTGSSFPVDYLVVNYNAPVNPRQLWRTYNPRCIIIGNNYSRKEQEEWVQKAKPTGIQIHVLSRDGAFVAEK